MDGEQKKERVDDEKKGTPRDWQRVEVDHALQLADGDGDGGREGAGDGLGGQADNYSLSLLFPFFSSSFSFFALLSLLLLLTVINTKQKAHLLAHVVRTWLLIVAV